MSGILDHNVPLRRLTKLPLGALLVSCLLLVVLPPAVGDQAPSVRDSAWPLTQADAPRLWRVSRGEGITVALVDSGVDASHPDLRGRVLSGGDFGDGSTAGGTQDVGGQRGHGTEMAGVIAATGMNFDRHGLSGVAPGARILSYGAYRNRLPDPRAVARAVRAAVARGAEIIVIPPVERGRADVASAVRRAIARDVVVIAGTGAGTQTASTASTTGTTAATTGQPATVTRAAALPGVVDVAAVDRQGQVWPAGGGSRHAVVAAPGVDILAAAADGTYWTGDDSGFAAAWVAGVAALVRSEHPRWTAAQTIQKIIDTAHRERAGCPQGCGYGVVNAVRAVTDTTRPTATTNPLLAAGPRRSTAPSPVMGVPPDRLLVFAVSSLAALALYVAVTALFIHRARRRGGGLDGTVT